MQEQIFILNRTKAEAPLYTLFILAAFIGFLSLFSFGFIPLIILGAVLSVAFFVVRNKLAGKYYIKVNNTGIEFRMNILKKAAFLPWDYVNQVNFHLYEVNLRLRDTNKVINLQTNYLKESEVETFVELMKTQFNKASKPTMV